MVQFVIGLVIGVTLIFILAMGAVLANEERWDELHWDELHRGHPPEDDDGCRVDDQRDQED